MMIDYIDVNVLSSLVNNQRIFDIDLPSDLAILLHGLFPTSKGSLTPIRGLLRASDYQGLI